jgi:hypothetical protein
MTTVRSVEWRVYFRWFACVVKILKSLFVEREEVISVGGGRFVTDDK